MEDTATNLIFNPSRLLSIVAYVQWKPLALIVIFKVLSRDLTGIAYL